MRPVRFVSAAILASLFAVSALVLSGCGSTPPKDEAAAPIEDRSAGGARPGTTGGADPRIGGTPGAASGSTIDLTKPAPGAGPAAEVKAGILAERSIFFDFDSDAINEKFRPMLQAHANYLSKNRNAKMLIQGNTDERGGREYNLALGQRRAEAIKKLVTLLGAQDAQVEAVSLGEEKPRRTGRSEEDYRENRRGDLLHTGEF